MLKSRAGDIIGSAGPPAFAGQDERDVLMSREETAVYLRVSILP